MKIENVEKIQNLRISVIYSIYEFELFNNKIDLDRIFENMELTDKETSVLKGIEKNYEKLKKIISPLIKNREWSRISPLLRSILIFGSFEMYIHDKALVINELIEITKIVSPGSDYKLVNAILSKVGNLYEQKKK